MLRNRPEVVPGGYDQCQTDRERLMYLLRYATLAPSTINTQPWLFRLDEARRAIHIFANLERKLKLTDPTGREMFVSLGACVTNLCLASEAYGLIYTKENQNFQHENEGVTIRFDSLKQSKVDHETLRAIAERHTNRMHFDQIKALDKKFINYLKNLETGEVTLTFLDHDHYPALQKILGNAIQEVFSNSEFRKEVGSWFRPSTSKVNDGFPGYYLGIPRLLSYIMPFLVKHVDISQRQRAAHEDMIRYASGYIVFETTQDNISSWFAVGQLFERIAIEATKMNIKIGILTAPIEVADARNSLSAQTGNNLLPQLFIRLGYTDQVPKFSPRIPIEKLIIS